MASATPQNPDWIPTAPVRIDRSGIVDAPVDHIWARLADNETWPEWFPGFRMSRFTSEEPHGLGSIRVVHQDQFLVTERITAWEPNQRWGMTVTDINVPIIASMAEDVHLTDVAGGTRIDWAIGVELTRLGRLFRPLLEAKSAKGLDTALANLAQSTR